LTEDGDYNKLFYDQFSKNIKLAIHEDSANRTKLLDLLRIHSSTSEDKLISLKTYVLNMKENQAGIYYIIGNTQENVKKSAFIDKLIKKDYEVLLMIDPLDEYIMQSITEYSNTKFINVMKDDLKLEDKKDNNEEEENVCKKIKEILGDKLESVKISNKLESQPAIVTSPMGWSANMERIMKAQALHNGISSFMMERKVLEINLEHKLIKKLIENEYNEEYINIIYNIGLLAGGYDLTDVNDFLIKLYNYL
jgi:molecular chaperone HtpG